MARRCARRCCSPTATSCPAATEQALGRLVPTGAEKAGGAQVIRVGEAAVAEGYKTTAVEGADYAALAQAIDRLQTAAAGKPSPAVVVASAEQPGFSMPAAGWAAKSGDPVLWVTRDAIPPATRAAITSHKRPRIYVLGPESAVSGEGARSSSTSSARRGASSGADPVANAIAFARFSDGSFGWNVVDPGHGLVFATTQRPLDAAAAAPLSASGTYGPLLLVTAANALPAPLQDYLLDIQPGYDADPVRGVYNHGWLIGDEDAISVDVQARIDALLEIQAVDRGDGLVDSRAMAEAEQPERRRPEHRVTVDDVRQLMGASTPHFALQLRNRIRKLIAPLPPEDPARGSASRRSRGSSGSPSRARSAASDEQPGQRPMPSLGEDEPTRYVEGPTRG